MRIKFLLCTITVSLICGCSAQRQLTNDFHSPQTKSVNRDLIVGVMPSGSAPTSLSYSDGTFSCTVDMTNVRSAVSSEMKSHFKIVRNITRAEDCRDCDLFATYDLGFDIERRAFDVAYDAKMGITFLSKTGEYISSFVAHDSGIGSAIAASALTGLTLGLTAQLTAEAYASEMQNKVQYSVSKMLTDIGRDIEISGNLSVQSVKSWDENAQQKRIEKEKARSEYVNSLRGAYESATKGYKKCVTRAVSEYDDGRSDIDIIASAIDSLCYPSLEIMTRIHCEMQGDSSTQCENRLYYLNTKEARRERYAPWILRHRVKNSKK